MNFIQEFKKGQRGGNKGLPLLPGLSNINKVINGIQKGRIYGVAAAPKGGKSTFVDYSFLLSPYLHSCKPEVDIDIEWIYFSFELDRVSKEFDIAAFFLFYDHNITKVNLPEGVTKKDKKIINLTPDYLRGRIQDDKEQIIQVSTQISEKLKLVYEERIVPLFGRYDSKGKQIEKGKIKFVEDKDNPTGLRNLLFDHANKHGSFIKEGHKTNRRITGYNAKNPDKYTIVITDHLRKLLPEKGFQMKQTVDKFIEYSVEFRNWCGWTFAHIIHLNRAMTDVQRLKQFGSNIFPNSDDIKDTGNLSEDADYVFTMFNPNDERYNLDRHFGRMIKDSRNNELYPDLRTVHLVESRHCEFPQHFSVNMLGGQKNFKKVEFLNK